MPNTSPRLVAGGDIRPSRFVKMEGSAAAAYGASLAGPDIAKEADAGEAVIGISMEGSNQPPLFGTGPDPALAASIGQSFKLYGQGDECMLTAGVITDIVPGARLQSDADGKAIIAAAATAATGAICLETPIADGELFRVQVELNPAAA